MAISSCFVRAEHEEKTIGRKEKKRRRKERRKRKGRKRKERKRKEKKLENLTNLKISKN
jgi:hypothetical protein